MVTATDEAKEAARKAAEQSAKPPEQATPPVDPKAGEKIYSEVEFQTKADGLLREQYNKTNVTLSAQGIELAKLRPMEAENETLRANVKKLNDDIDNTAEAGAPENPTFQEVIKMRRTLREERTTHEDAVRAHSVKVAEFDTKETQYNTWDDKHNMENESSIAFIADKFKVKPEALKDIPREGRVTFAERLAGTPAVPDPANPPETPPVNPSPLEDGLGQGGQQLTGNAAAAAALKRARDKQRNNS